VEGLRTGVVYTETIVHVAPARFAADVPYQVIIARLDDGASVTGRVNEEFVAIGDRVVEVEVLDGVPYFVRSN
jgi:uncharacterized OB-fold protein